jgi:hypothetical protein
VDRCPRLHVRVAVPVTFHPAQAAAAQRFRPDPHRFP